MQSYPWPGNIRELRNAIERVVLLSSADRTEIRAQDLPLFAPSSAPRATVGSDVTLAELERHHIAAVLSQSNWHQGHAAKTLGISSKTLYRKIREYGLSRPKKD
jgi:DNA-binding NtrC family response regulator